MKKIGMILILCLIMTNYLFSCAIGNVPASSASDLSHLFLPLISTRLSGYFVSPDGSDTNPGTFSEPWKTIGKAAEMVNPGDTVYIRGGIYIEAPRLTISGTEKNLIKILAYPGETPVVDGENQLPHSYRGLVSIFGDWVYISGLEIRNSIYAGLGLYGKHDTANDIFAHHNQSSGIHIGGDFGVVENSHIWRNSMHNEFDAGSGVSPGLTAARDSDGITEYAVIRNNVVWENWGRGISTFEANGTIIEDNISHDNFYNIYISDATNILCQRNFVYTNPGSYVFPYGTHAGIMLGDETYTPPSASITIINNIAFGNQGNFWWWQGVQGGGMDNVLIANNTFVNGIGNPGQGREGVIISSGDHQNVRFETTWSNRTGDPPVIATIDQPDVTYSYNLWSKHPYEAASGPGDVIGDPMLAKTGEPYLPDWFRLTDFSPAIDQALLIPEVIDDYFGNLRGSFPDMGAIEYYPE